MTKDTVHSSYGHSDKMSHLDEPGLRMAHIAAQNYPTEKQSLIHIIDREADSVYHLREWDAAGHPFLVRMRGYSGVTRDGKTYKAQELEREPNYSFYKNVHYQGKQVAGTEVVLTRESNAKWVKGGIPR
ncbi:hypothetical protein [Cardiobacterium valvarum]|uniref:Uncharacterized protein n=1 Tax=Cardiobacterium valvarum TaxID=194702 RepID=A0A381DZP2_9GAMM|nr:hypothetical protein [Cardiobacterium valvarum]SUX18935.1 Uncharacterised protein [Cardiobacterium valvarum]